MSLVCVTRGLPIQVFASKGRKEGGIDFRDFHSLNLAMLAKQVWRLINEPDLLCAQVLRAKYYPHGDILKVGPKGGSSFQCKAS
jgi:hypothetical protein